MQLGTDTNGNQFVWVPVGKIKNKDKSTTEIELARYTFDVDGAGDEPRNATGKITQKILDGGMLVEGELITEYYEQKTSDTSYKISSAKDIDEFVNNTKVNNGYYIARYDASMGANGKAESKANKKVWNFISKEEALGKSQTMYDYETYKLNSDLVNSYSMDTAIVFIQEYADSDYSNLLPRNDNRTVTGKNNDKVCNIHDIASNVGTWTTENSNTSELVCRGGVYNSEGYLYAMGRNL